jgi:hypothetical protein
MTREQAEAVITEFAHICFVLDSATGTPDHHYCRQEYMEMRERLIAALTTGNRDD